MFPPEEQFTIIKNMEHFEIHVYDWVKLQKESDPPQKLFSFGSREFFQQFKNNGQIILSVVEGAQIKINKNTLTFHKGCVIYLLNNILVYRFSDVKDSFR